MATKTLKTVPKISVKIWRPILDKLDAKIESACLRRDAYLAKVLEVELDWLDQEVSIPNSQASYDYVLERLDRLAAQTNRSRNELINLLLDSAMEIVKVEE